MRHIALPPPLLLLLLPVLLAACGKSVAQQQGNTAPSEPKSSPETVEWQVTILNADTLDIRERICWRGFAPDYVRPEAAVALPFATKVARDDIPASLDDIGVSTKGRASGCVTVEMSLTKMGTALDDERLLSSPDGGIVYGSFDPWLWSPTPWPKGMRGRLTFVEKPAEVIVSMPHEQDPADGSYEIPFSTWSYMARVAIGKGLDIDDNVEASGARLSIIRLPGVAPQATKEGIRNFLRGAASAVATVDTTSHKMPVKRLQAILGGGGNGKSIGFGMAMRGAGPAITLRVGRNAQDAALFGEWITTHEMAHLWLPPVDRDNAVWLSEGLASYYQCVLRSRVGMYKEEDAWDELVSGFDRGKRQAATLPLGQAKRPRFQHIYWGGAAILFKIDVDLRKRGSSLDQAVAAVRHEVPRDDNDKSLDEVLERLQRGAHLPPGAPSYATMIKEKWLRQPFVDTDGELRDLGIARKGDTVVLSDDAPLAKIRRAIAAKR